MKSRVMSVPPDNYIPITLRYQLQSDIGIKHIRHLRIGRRITRYYYSFTL
jgi:hypothetical protein